MFSTLLYDTIASFTNYCLPLGYTTEALQQAIACVGS